jgi:hypothetical protein
MAPAAGLALPSVRIHYHAVRARASNQAHPAYPPPHRRSATDVWHVPMHDIVSVYLSVCLSVHVCVCLSVCLFVCISVHVCVDMHDIVSVSLCVCVCVCAPVGLAVATEPSTSLQKTYASATVGSRARNAVSKAALIPSFSRPLSASP